MPTDSAALTIEPNTNYAPLRRETAVARYWVDEEINYCRLSIGYAQQNSRARLTQWGKRFPWVAARVAAALGPNVASLP